MAKRRAKKRVAEVSAEDFVKAWMKGGTPKEVADRLGMNYRTFMGRGQRLRAAGVPLPKLTEGRGAWHKLDVAKLNKLVRG